MNNSMSRYLSTIALVVVGLVVFSACKKKEVDPKLVIEEQTLDFSQNAEEKEFTIDANEAWTATKADDWFEITPAEGGGRALVTVSVSENDSGTPRKSEVTVVLNNHPNITRTVSIVQSSSSEPDEINVFVEPNPYTFKAVGGDVGLTVTATNADTWEVVTRDTESWLLVEEYDVELGLIFITAEPNILETPRSTTFSVEASNKDSKKVCIVTINQLAAAVEEQDLILPCMDFLIPQREVEYFEVLRDSRLISMDEESLLFAPQSSFFDGIEYQFRLDSYVVANMLLSELGIVNKSDYVAFLTDNGFITIDDVNFMDSEGRAVVTYIDETVDPEAKPHFHFASMKTPEIPEDDYETFKSFPWGLMDFEGGKAEIEAYEAEAGGVLNEELSIEGRRYVYDIPQKDYPAFQRIYFLDEFTRTLSETAQLFKETTLALKTIGSESFLTTAFKKLSESEGWQYLYYDEEQEGHIFRNMEKQKSLLVGEYLFPDIDPVNKLLDIRMRDMTTD